MIRTFYATHCAVLQNKLFQNVFLCTFMYNSVSKSQEYTFRI